MHWGIRVHMYACRRRLLALSLGFLALEQKAAADQEEDSLYSLGEINGVLNACPLNSLSCASTQNDDEAHFIAPWQVINSLSAQYLMLAAGLAYSLAYVYGACEDEPSACSTTGIYRPQSRGCFRWRQVHLVSSVLCMT